MTPEQELDRVLHLALHAVEHLTAGTADIVDGKVVVGFFMGDIYWQPVVPTHLQTIAEARAWVAGEEKKASQKAQRRDKALDDGWANYMSGKGKEDKR